VRDVSGTYTIGCRLMASPAGRPGEVAGGRPARCLSSRAIDHVLLAARVRSPR
jgi:hypothetical protein